MDLVEAVKEEKMWVGRVAKITQVEQSNCSNSNGSKVVTRAKRGSNLDWNWVVIKEWEGEWRNVKHR